MNTLFIRLEGPLQSWGVRARWTDRDTMLEPTKSGVTGLLAGALGWGRDQDDAIRELAEAVTFGVRVDSPGRVVRDYQAVFGGAMSAQGKVKLTPSTREPETVVSPRWYLADASFLAAVQADSGWIERLSMALREPVWPPYLGRKSCPPSVPLWDDVGQFANLQDALTAHYRSPRAEAGRLRATVETGHGQGIPRRDQVQVLSRRIYRPRYAEEIFVNPPLPPEEE